jgi:ribonuclease Y
MTSAVVMYGLAVLSGIIVGAVGLGLGRSVAEGKKRRNARSQADRILSRAKYEAQRVEKEAERKGKEIEGKIKKNAEQEIKQLKNKIAGEENQLKQKEKELEREFERMEQSLEDKKKHVREREEKIDILEKRTRENEEKTRQQQEELARKLEGVAGMSKEEAKTQLVEAVRSDAEVEAKRQAVIIENEARAEAERKAKRVLSMAINRYAGEYTAERTISVVALPSDEMKGRIIGREGRNIRALESLCGVDLIIDDTPEAVVISGFDPTRRELARRTLNRLMEDGRVHPARIEEIFNKEKGDFFKSIKEDGEAAILDLGLHGVNPEIVKLVGALKYRTSYTQNNYVHSLEVGFISGVIASEMGQDIKAARRAGLLHDIGKALDHSIGGGHAVIGADFAKRHGEKEHICHAIRSHHEDEKPDSILAHIVTAADAVSAARPGARRHMMESYVQRLEDLESIANSFDGVVRSFAIQAGRELRVVVEGAKVTDEQSIMLSRDIARKIENELSYPGQIKVAVVRETRAVDHAR